MLLVGDINAGFPSAAEGYEDRQLNLHEWLVQNPAATIFYRVEGSELEPEHIMHGSVVIVDRSLVPPFSKIHLLKGKLVLVELNCSFVVCRFKFDQRQEVCGVVVGVVTKF
jgi:DNA polymerase V